MKTNLLLVVVLTTVASTTLAGERSGDFDYDGKLTVDDVNRYSSVIRSGIYSGDFDLNDDRQVNGEDLRVWVEGRFRTFLGDSNLDWQFETDDFVYVFQVGEFQDGVRLNTVYTEGDWNGDSDFDSSDFVSVFQAGCYEKGPRPSVSVPEPCLACFTFAFSYLILIGALRKHDGSRLRQKS